MMEAGLQAATRALTKYSLKGPTLMNSQTINLRRNSSTEKTWRKSSGAKI